MASPDPNDMVSDHSKYACHVPLAPIASNDIPMVEEVVLRMSPKEIHVWFDHKVENASGASDTPVENPPSYAMSGQHCIHTNGHIHLSHSKPYHQSNYFLGQHLGL